MTKSINRLVSVAIAIGFGLVVLAGYFFNIPLLQLLRNIFLRWIVILAAAALLVGVVNLFRVHWRKVTSEQLGGIYSGILILAMVLTIAVVGFFGPTAPWSMWIFNYIQVPVETSLMAILAVVLVYAGARLLNRRLNLITLVFIVTALIVLVGSASLPWIDFDILFRDARTWIERVPAAAGARGILLGIALGTIATGLRVLIGADRPYGG